MPAAPLKSSEKTVVQPDGGGGIAAVAIRGMTSSAATTAVTAPSSARPPLLVRVPDMLQLPPVWTVARGGREPPGGPARARASVNVSGVFVRLAHCFGLIDGKYRREE